MRRSRFVLATLVGVAGLALAARPAPAQQALAAISARGGQVQAFCLGADGRLAACTSASNLFTRTYEARNAFVFSTSARTCLDGAGGRGQPVRLAPCSNGLTQDWYHVDNRRVQNKANSLCLDVSGGRRAVGTPVILWPCSGADNQLFAAVAVALSAVAEQAGPLVPGGLPPLSPQDVRSMLAGGKQPAYAIAAGGYNLIGDAGGTFIGNASGNVIGNASGNLIGQAGTNVTIAPTSEAIAAGGGNAIAAGGGNAIAAGGGNAIAAGGGNAIAAGGGNAIAAGGGNFGVLSADGGADRTLLETATDFTCGLAAGGAAYCWGYNGYNQLGIDPYAPERRTPAAVAGGLSFGTISAHDQYACGVTTAGQLYCWGRFGAIGSRTPKAVEGGLAIRSVSAGDRFACAVTTSGQAHCWGKNASGELGNGTTRDSYYALTPVAGGSSFASVSAGDRHACGVTASGAAYCWGFNLHGQLGATTPGDRSATPVAVAGGLTFRSVSAGSDYTCGVTRAGEAYCWGANQYGQSAGSTSSSIRQPTRVGALTATAISTGTGHTCAVTTDAAVHCWGRNGSGELGDGTTTPRRTPAPVTGGLRFLTVTVGRTRTCGLTTGGEAYCWGSNGNGAIGDGSTTVRHVPTRVAGWTPAGS